VGRDKPVDDGNPRKRLVPAKAGLGRVHRPSTRTLDPLLPLTIGRFAADQILITKLCLREGDATASKYEVGGGAELSMEHRREGGQTAVADR